MSLNNKFFIALFCMILSISAQEDQKSYLNITVDKNGGGDFIQIQAAINSTRDLGSSFVEIHIKNGIYYEKIEIPTWKHKLLLIGETKDKTIIINNDFSGKKDSLTGDVLSTFTSHTLKVSGDDIELNNLTLKNSSCGEGQAVALFVEGDKFIGKNLKILGCQDTLYAARGSSRQYYKNCYIEGTTDFIFGQATVLFENCIIKSLKNSYITAAATTMHQEFGFVFLNCKLLASKDVDKVYLGRPWRPFAQTVFINSELGKHISPFGWDAWEGDNMFPDKVKTTFYAEYKNFGAGANPKNRVKWSYQLSKKEAEKYTIENIFQHENEWNPTK